MSVVLAPFYRTFLAAVQYCTLEPLDCIAALCLFSAAMIEPNPTATLRSCGL